jgi:hypothetical protein
VGVSTPSTCSTPTSTSNIGPGYWASLPKDRYSDVLL